MAYKVNKLPEIPFTQNILCRVLLKLEIFKSCQYIFSLMLLHVSPLEKKQGPSFERNRIPLTQLCSVPSLVEIGPVFLEYTNDYIVYYAVLAIFRPYHG